jgi:hypothetical protein
MKPDDKRKHNGGRREGSGRKQTPKEQKPVKKAVYVHPTKMAIIERLHEDLNFNQLVNRLLDNHIAEFNTF